MEDARYKSPISHRRFRFRFTLRVAFLTLTVAALWLGWQANTIQQRKKAISLLRKSGAEVFVDSGIGGNFRFLRWGGETPPPNFLRLGMGDTAVSVVLFPRTMLSEGFNDLTAEELWCVETLSEAAVVSY